VPVTREDPSVLKFKFDTLVGSSCPEGGHAASRCSTEKHLQLVRRFENRSPRHACLDDGISKITEWPFGAGG
jgi:hypothetical protein